MSYYTMRHYVTKTSDGLVHVQNAVGGMFGQHHVHTEQGYENWKREAHISDDTIEVMKVTDSCPCGLKAGDVKEYDGKVWNNDRFEHPEPAPKKVKVKQTKQTKLRRGY